MERWRRTLLVTAVAQSFSILGFSFVIPFTPLYIQTLGIHGTTSITLWAALLSGSVAIGMMVAAPIWGVLADRHGRKIMLIRAAFSAAILVGLMGAATNVYQLLALRLLQGAFTGTVSAAQALVASQTPKDRLGFSLGTMQTAVFVGSSTGPLVGGLVAQWLGFRPAFGIAACLLMTCALLVLFFVHEERVPVKQVAGAPRPSLLAGMRDVLTVPALLAMVATFFAVQYAVTQVFPILPQLVQQLQGRAGHAAVATGVILAGAGVAGAISSTTVGSFSDRIGHRTILITAALGACCITVPQAFVTATWQLAVLRVADGLCLGAMLPSASAMLAGLVPAERRGAAYGFSQSANSLGILLGPLTTAAIVAVSGIRDVFFSAAVLLAFIALWVSTRVHVGAGESRAPRRSTSEAQAARPDPSRAVSQ
jgi:MFS family permease